MANKLDPEITEGRTRLLSWNHPQEEILKINLEWKNIQCTLKSKFSTKNILKGISGYAKSGEFLAIMGTSGAGKTTLLNLISGTTKSSSTLETTGEILANDQLINTINYNKYVGYVTQEDILLDMLTVYESVLFAARLKTRGPEALKKQRVEAVLEELSLIKCKNTIIGNPVVKGVSGGEKKRVCIAIELITTPSILFLDEPTSGLDSYSSFQVMELLNSQAAKGRTVISTIHQPSSDIYTKFAKLLLLCDGHVMYHGDAKNAVSYFDSHRYSCPALSNPADYFMEILHIENLDSKTPEEEAKVNYLQAEFLKIQKNIEKPNFEYQELEKGTTGYVSSYPVQLYYCTKRAITITVRNPKLTILKAIVLLFVALMMNILFWNIGSNESQNVDPEFDKSSLNRNGSFFFALTILVYSNLNATILDFPLMREVFLKESRAKMYGTTAFFLSKNIGDLLVEVFGSILFGICIYWSIGYNTNSSEKPVIFLIISILVHMCGTSFGLTAGAWFTRVDVASSLGAIMNLPFYYYSGYLRPTDDIPVWIRWVSYTSPYRYGFDALMINQYSTNSPELSTYNISGTVGESIFYLFLVMIGFRIFAFIGLKYNSKV